MNKQKVETVESKNIKSENEIRIKKEDFITLIDVQNLKHYYINHLFRQLVEISKKYFKFDI